MADCDRKCKTHLEMSIRMQMRTSSRHALQADGFCDGTGRVCLLRRNLYGLKQASSCWNIKFVEMIAKFGLVLSTNDSCVFLRLRGSVLILGIYVDDVFVVAEDEKEIHKLIENLKLNFMVKTHGCDQFLGKEVNQYEDGHISLGQRAYAERIVSR